MNALKDTTNNIITRRIHAVIRGSLAQFANSGSESASWTSVNGRMSEILGITDLLQGTADTADGPTGSIKGNKCLSPSKNSDIPFGKCGT